MIPYDLVLAVGLVAEAWLLALVVLRTHRPWLKATFAALSLALIVNGAAFVGTAEGILPSSWGTTILWTMILSHPLTAILVLGLLHGEGLLRRRPIAFLLLLAVPELLVLAPGVDWAVRHAYDLNPLGGYLIACFAIALAEPIYQRSASPLLAGEATWLLIAVVALVIGGPVYTYEFEALGLATQAGANIAAPAALALFALVAVHTDPFAYPRIRRGQWSGEDRLARSQTYLFEEARPNYALRAIREESARGRPTLLLGRASIPSGITVASVTSDRHAGLRTLATACQFFAEHPGGVVGLVDVGDLVLMSGWPKTREMLVRLRGTAKDSRSTAVVSTSRLREEEKEDLRATGVAWWPLPNPVTELEAVLARSFGSGARQLLRSYAQARGMRPEHVTTDDVPSLAEFLNRAIAELSGAAADDSAHASLRAQTAAAVRDLRAFADRTPAQLAQGDWPSKRPEAAEGELLVTAADYWKGKEMDELFAVAADLGAREPLYARARSLFVEQLGDAGEGVLNSELAKLGRKPEDLRPEDVARLADRAAVDLIAMADIVDVPQEKARIRDRIDSIRRGLEAIAGDQS